MGRGEATQRQVVTGCCWEGVRLLKGRWLQFAATNPKQSHCGWYSQKRELTHTNDLVGNGAKRIGWSEAWPEAKQERAYYCDILLSLSTDPEAP